MVKFKNMITATVVLSLFFLFTVTGFCAEDGKVTMEQWLKIINSGDAKKSTSPKATETNNNDIDSTMTSTAEDIAVTVYWHMADDADVYLNGKPLRHYEPSFKTRSDEAPQPAFSALAVLNNGDVFTVGSRRGGSFGFMLIAVDSSGRVVFKTDQQSWKVYEPGDRADWYNPQVAMSSPTQPVTVQPDPWYPQKELNKTFGDIALSIWGAPSERFSYLTATVSLLEKKKAPEGKRPSVSTANEIKRDGRFIAYDDGTVLDTKTGLMWAARDNGSIINWQSAKSYCENYRGGGYTDWRMPTQDELAGLYDAAKTNRFDSSCGTDVHLTELIHLTNNWAWASETRGYEAAIFNFSGGNWIWYPQSTTPCHLALPVRSGIQNAPSSEVPLFKAETQGSPMNGTGGVAGTWNSNWGPVTLTHEPIVNNQPVYVTGSWNQGEGKIGQLTNGTFDPVGGVLKFSYYQPWNDLHGIQKFKLSNDGRKMEGHPDNEGGFEWVCTSSLQQGERPSVSTANEIKREGAEGGGHTSPARGTPVFEETFESGLSKIWEPVQVVGGNYSRFVKTTYGKFMVSVPEGNHWGKTGFMSRDSFFTVNNSMETSPLRISFDFDPNNTTGYVIGFSSGKNADMWLLQNAWLHWLKPSPSEGQIYFMNTQNSAENGGSAKTPTTPPKNVTFTIRPGKMDVSTSQNTQLHCNFSWLKAGTPVYMYIFSHPANDNGPASFSLESIRVYK